MDNTGKSFREIRIYLSASYLTSVIPKEKKLDPSDNVKAFDVCSAGISGVIFHLFQMGYWSVRTTHILTQTHE